MRTSFTSTYAEGVLHNTLYTWVSARGGDYECLQCCRAGCVGRQIKLSDLSSSPWLFNPFGGCSVFCVGQRKETALLDLEESYHSEFGSVVLRYGTVSNVRTVTTSLPEEVIRVQGGCGLAIKVASRP